MQNGSRLRTDQSPTLKKNKIEKLNKLHQNVIEKLKDHEGEVAKLEHVKAALEQKLHEKKVAEQESQSSAPPAV